MTSAPQFEVGSCPRALWYKEHGRRLRSEGWKLRTNGPKWDAQNALIQCGACPMCDGLGYIIEGEQGAQHTTHCKNCS